MKRQLSYCLYAALLAVTWASAVWASDGTEFTVSDRWTAKKAWAWYEKQPWLVGCNFLPSSAVNDVEMWQKESFDAKTIDRELGWAQDLGFNTVRVFVNYAVWEADPDALKGNLRRFLEIANRHGIVTLVILFDDCFKPEPQVGKQPDPEPGVHNSQWVQSPGAKRRGDRTAWPKLEKYIKDVVGTFASDKRVLAWELYNEPSQSLPLVEAAFKWAREAKPSQPVTTTIFGDVEMQKRIIVLSDVLCFHHYGPLSDVKTEAGRLLAHGRPVLCTEWMARGDGSRFETHLPFFKENRIACWNWGLVAGRTQTYFPWGSPKAAPEPRLWHHDILRTDGTPFNAREVQFIKVTTGKLSASDSVYRGWKSLALRNGLIELQVLPEIGGRIIQFKLGGKEFLWVNPQLAGQFPPSNGLAADGGWFNVGGDKLWPAPQGWDNDAQWPGPPDAVLDGQPYRAELLDNGTAVRLTSRDDPRSGIRFSRTVRPLADRSGVRFEATMTNVDAKPRRWGIWAHTQLDASKRDGPGFNSLMRAYCLLNPQSSFPRGYGVIFGEEDNPSFHADRRRGLLCVDYRYQVGKIGVDSPGGWVATVDGAGGAVFVQRFTFEPKKEYPDGASVEFWHNGTGKIHAYNKDMTLSSNPAENPFVFESEVLSPLVRLSPGESYTWHYEWFAANIGGDFPVIGCNDTGVIAGPLQAKRTDDGWRLTGRFGVFLSGRPLIQWRDSRDGTLGTIPVRCAATPVKPLELDETFSAPAGARTAALVIEISSGQTPRELARVVLP